MSIDTKLFYFICDYLISNDLIDDKFPINFNTKFIDIPMQSVDNVQLILEIEEEFEVNIPDEKTEIALTIGELCWVVKQYLFDGGNNG